MFSNTANSSASDNVKTLPKLKAYFGFIKKLQLDEHKIALIAGYMLTAGLFFGLGQYLYRPNPPQIQIEEPAVDLSKLNLTPNPVPAQQVAGESLIDSDDDLNCDGQIKGNISGSGKIYHVPGGASYKQTIPELCFATEAQAQAAGFRKSRR